VQVINSGTPAEYLSGEVNVSVKGNQNPIIRLALAQNGVNIIEFPASDSFFMIHPGNSELVAFDQETAEKSRRSLVLRPGASFITPAAGSQSKRLRHQSVQMQSGLVVTFLIYPVRDVTGIMRSDANEEVVASSGVKAGAESDGMDRNRPR
jgi:hypothetical protein